MFDKYYFKEIGDDLFYYEAKNGDKNVIMKLFKNEKLLDQKQGLLGTFTLQEDIYRLEVKNTALKSIHKFSINEEEVELQKIKLKNLKVLLSEKGIFNEINPTKEEIEERKIQFGEVLIPVFLLMIGLAIQYFARNGNNIYEYISFIPVAIAGWLLYDISATRISWLKKLRKARLGFIVLLIIFVGVLAEFLFKS